MNPLDQQLIYFSLIFAFVLSLALVLPPLLGNRDWLTAWNLFLVGSIIFTGMSGINAATYWDYMSYSKETYLRYYFGVAVFYGVIFWVYYYNRWPRRIAGGYFLKWPNMSVYALLALVALLSAFSLFRIFTPNVPLLGQLLAQFSLQAPFVAATIAFVAWFRDRSNPILIAIMIGAFVAALFFGIIAGGGRRYLINALLVPIVCLYWLHLRYRSNAYNLISLLCLISAALPFYLGYNALRHSDRKLERSALERGVDILKTLPSKLSFQTLLDEQSLDTFMGQDSVECALATIELMNDGSERLTTRPLFTLHWIIVNPIPRQFWGDKPESLGYYLPYVLGMGPLGKTKNVGVNVVGQAYYDGGVVVWIFYAFLFGSFLRILDELLTRQPNNPFLLAFLVCSASQIIGWPRGGLDIMTLQIISPAVLILIVAYFGRAVFGTGYVAPRTVHVDRFPNRFELRSWHKSLASS